MDYPKIMDLVIASTLRPQNEQGTTYGPHICMDASGLGAPIRDYLLKSGVINGGKSISFGFHRRGSCTLR
ncbi:MAG: hypothetical protein LUQ59_06290 [Methanothrix sp.]|nr:hypothetical protein [Methanothrix sp.]